MEEKKMPEPCEAEKAHKAEPPHKAEKKHKKRKIYLYEEDLEELKICKEDSEKYHDRLLRLRAEFENFRKRMEKEKTEFLRYANEQLIFALLPVMDNFGRAISSARENQNVEAVLEGVSMIEKGLADVLDKFGVKQIRSMGEKFDPHRHEAIGVVESKEHSEDTIVEELQKGYLLNDRLIRPAVVKVAKEQPPK